MTERERMDALFAANGCDSEAVYGEIHRLVLMWGLQALCRRMKKEPDVRKRVLDIYRRNRDDVYAAEQIAEKYLGICLPQEDARWMNRCLLAHFGRDGRRQAVSQEKKTAQIARQHGVCACCGAPVTAQKGHYDHVVPWELVGDGLDENYQVLCPRCNGEKSSSVDYMAKRLFYKKY